MMTSSVGKNIKQLRIKKCYSQEQLAEHTGLSVRTIQRIEKGDSVPRGHSLKNFRSSFGL